MTFRWRLCLLISFSVVVSRPSTTSRAELPESGWWRAKESRQLQSAARRQIAAGDYASAERTFAEGVRQSERHNYRISAGRYLSGMAGARRARFDYQGALKAYQEAKRISESVEDWLNLGAIDLNLSALYEDVWDLDSALQAAQEALQASEKTPDAYYEPELLLQMARLSAERGNQPAQDPIPTLIRAIDSARREEQVSVEARGWSLLGEQRLNAGDLEAAEKAYLQAFYLRQLFFPRDLGFSYLDLGALRLRQAEAEKPGPSRDRRLDQAGRFTELAQEEDSRGAANLDTLLLRQQQGRIRLARNDIGAALEQLGEAVDAAAQWRQGIPMAFTSMGGATAEIEERVFSEFIETAADYGIKTHNSKWIEQSFLAQQLARTANLGGGRALALGLRQRLPDRFWPILAQLRSEETRMEGSGISDSPAYDRLRLELTNMEAEANFGVNFENLENFRSSRSLTQYQHGISDSEVLLSFHLGTQKSFLWAMTRSSLSVYRLPPRDRVRSMVRGFREAIESDDEPGHSRPGATVVEQRAEELYGVLFGELNRQETGKRDWLVSPADALLQLPFAALVPKKEVGNPVYLVQLHSLKIESGGGPSRTARDKPAESLLAVGDPIYNVADPRLVPARTGLWEGFRSWFGAAPPPPAVQLNRLPGSGREAESVARMWSKSTLLEGQNASKQRFEEALRAESPGTIHLATHVLTLRTGANESFLAFGLGSQRQPELMGTSEVAMLNIPGALVVMTGCESAGGDLRAGIGLENLARAWTLAGARAVVATQWPVKDSSGEFLGQFYEKLRDSAPAVALQETQVAMIRSGTRSSVPAAWASYQVYGGVE